MRWPRCLWPCTCWTVRAGKQVVSTLRFWVAAEQPAVAARRRKIQQPWSLILQLVSMTLLLLAVAELHFGGSGPSGRDHVVILDTSAWMARAVRDNRTLMDIGTRAGGRMFSALPARDRVMLVRADGLATPATVFEPDHRKVEAAIGASQSRLDGFEPGAGTRVRAPHAVAGGTPRRRNRLRRNGTRGGTRCRDCSGRAEESAGDLRLRTRWRTPDCAK